MANAYKPEEYQTVELDPPVILEGGRVVKRIEYVPEAELTFNDVHAISKSTKTDDYLGNFKAIVNLTGQIVEEDSDTVIPLPKSFWASLKSKHLASFTLANEEAIDPN